MPIPTVAAQVSLPHAEGARLGLQCFGGGIQSLEGARGAAAACARSLHSPFTLLHLLKSAQGQAQFCALGYEDEHLCFQGDLLLMEETLKRDVKLVRKTC